MTTIPRERLVILAAEGVAIVASILLAFAIDAWWDDRLERRQEAALLDDLYADFEASQAHLQQWLSGNRFIERSTASLLDRLRSAEPDERVTVTGDLLVGAVSTPTYTPTDSTLRVAIASGQLELIQNADLRKELAAWQQLLEDTREDEILIREIVVHRVIPVLSGQVRLGYVLDFDIIVGLFFGQSTAFAGQQFELRADSALEAAVAERLFHTKFVVQGLSDLAASQARILDLLTKQVGK